MITSRFTELHPWRVSPRRAREIQQDLREHVCIEDDVGPVHFVAGVDVGFENGGQTARAAVALLAYPELALCDFNTVRCSVTFPYISGLLSFREVPALLRALEGLARSPDLILCDGQGIAHPRGFGLACHLGLVTNLPTIGVAKTRLVGEYREPGMQRGARSVLKYHGRRAGTVLRTRTGTKPLFISPGHRVDFASSVRWVMACTTRYRLPETTRAAHRLASWRAG